MKQPKTEIEVYQYRFRRSNHVCVSILASDDLMEEVEISNGKTEKLALSAAIRRLNRLANDCQKKLDKL